jgi:hypothetical protein
MPLNGNCLPSAGRDRKVLLPSSCSTTERDIECEQINSCDLCASQPTCVFCPSAAGAGGGGLCQSHTPKSTCLGGVELVVSASSCPRSRRSLPVTDDEVTSLLETSWLALQFLLFCVFVVCMVRTCHA